jgi:hypothetical protein
LISFLLITKTLITHLLPKFACLSSNEHINSLRGQFWGRAALAPVILSDPGASNFQQQRVAPSFSRFLRKGWEITNLIVTCPSCVAPGIQEPSGTPTTTPCTASVHHPKLCDFSGISIILWTVDSCTLSENLYSEMREKNGRVGCD